MEKKSKRKSIKLPLFLKSLWFWMIIIGVALCALNIWLSWKYRSAETSNVFAAISGWVSGVATLVVGVIAFLQNKHYVLASAKREVKDSIRGEQNKIVEICDEMTQYSGLKRPLAILVNNNVTAKDLISYGLEVDALREKFLATNHLIQLFNYIPCSMCPLVEKATDMMMTTYKQYQDAKNHYSNDSILGQDIKNISDFIQIWISEIMDLCKKANGELTTFSQRIDSATSITELQNILQEVEQQTVKARSDVNGLLEKTLKEVQNNG